MKNDFGFKSNITKPEIDDLPIKQFSGQIYFVDSIQGFEEVLPLLKNTQVLGFDTETKPAFKKGVRNQVALLQLSTQSNAFLFRLNKLGLPKELIKILASPEVVKVGVAIHDDIKELQERNNFIPAGFIDLQNYVENFGIEDKGLKKLAANILEFKISKRQQTSNWEAQNLSQAQIEYAATDAWVCFEIYTALINLRNDRN